MRNVEIFIKLVSLKTIVIATTVGSPKDMVTRLVSDGYKARRVGSDMIVIEEQI